MRKVRILVVEDHTLVRAGIRMLLEKQPDMEVVGEAADGAEAAHRARELQPDIVLMDLAMPGISGLEAMRRLKDECPTARTIVLTMLEDERYFFQSIHAGASGFLLKGALPDEMLAAVRAVADGKVYLYPSLAKKLVEEYLSQSQQIEGGLAAGGLTEREQQVLQLFSEGRTGKEIAKSLGISVHTVERHRQNLMAKLNLHNRVELVKYALQKGPLETGK